MTDTVNKALCKLRQLSKQEIAVINEMLDGALSKHISADLKIEIRELNERVKELEQENAELRAELGKGSNQSLIDEDFDSKGVLV